MSGHRLERVESLLTEEIGRLILSGEIKDPRVDTMAGVHGVKVSKDLTHARVRISGYLEPTALEAAVEGLNSAAGFIQKRLASRITLRVTPRLQFVIDTSIQEGFRINKTIEDIVR